MSQLALLKPEVLLNQSATLSERYLFSLISFSIHSLLLNLLLYCRITWTLASKKQNASRSIQRTRKSTANPPKIIAWVVKKSSLLIMITLSLPWEHVQILLTPLVSLKMPISWRYIVYFIYVFVYYIIFGDMHVGSRRCFENPEEHNRLFWKGKSSKCKRGGKEKDFAFCCGGRWAHRGGICSWASWFSPWRFNKVIPWSWKVHLHNTSGGRWSHIEHVSITQKI